MINIDAVTSADKDNLLKLWHKLKLGDNIPTIKSLLISEICYELQRKEYGDLHKNEKVKLSRLVRYHKDGKSTKINHKITNNISDNILIEKEYLGKLIEVKKISANQFEYLGETYKSLSKIAKIITGQHISGPKFFGLK